MEGAPKFAESQTPARRRLRRLRPQPRPGRRQHRHPDAIGPAWDARAGRGPADRAGHPLRPRRAADPAARHLRAGQGDAAGAILHGDEDAWGFVKQGVKQKAQQYLPGTKDEELTCMLHPPC